MKKISTTIFESLFKEHYSSLCYFANRFVNATEIAEDIVEEAFIKLWNTSLNSTDNTSVKNWLYKTVRNTSLDHLRREKTKAERKSGFEYVHHTGTETFPLLDMIRAEVLQELDKALQMLPAGCRKVFDMYYFEGKDIQRIAVELNISVNTVKSHKARGLYILRSKLSPLLLLLIL